jgi:hypothetical protein
VFSERQNEQKHKETLTLLKVPAAEVLELRVRHAALRLDQVAHGVEKLAAQPHQLAAVVEHAPQQPAQLARLDRLNQSRHRCLAACRELFEHNDGATPRLDLSNHGLLKRGEGQILNRLLTLPLLTLLLLLLLCQIIFRRGAARGNGDLGSPLIQLGLALALTLRTEYGEMVDNDSVVNSRGDISVFFIFFLFVILRRTATSRATALKHVIIVVSGSSRSSGSRATLLHALSSEPSDSSSDVSASTATAKAQLLHQPGSLVVVSFIIFKDVVASGALAVLLLLWPTWRNGDNTAITSRSS